MPLADPARIVYSLRLLSAVPARTEEICPQPGLSNRLTLRSGTPRSNTIRAAPSPPPLTGEREYLSIDGVEPARQVRARISGGNGDGCERERSDDKWQAARVG